MKPVNVFDYFYVMSTNVFQMIVPRDVALDFLYEMERIATVRFSGLNYLRNQFSDSLKEKEEIEFLWDFKD